MRQSALSPGSSTNCAVPIRVSYKIGPGRLRTIGATSSRAKRGQQRLDDWPNRGRFKSLI